MKKVRQQIYKYKKVLIVCVLFLSSAILLMWVILPQFSNISLTRADIKKQEETLTTVQSSLKIVEAQDSNELTQYFSLVNHALPVSKDVSQIFSALSTAVSLSKTQLEDFSLNVGGVYGRAANSLSPGVGAVPSIKVLASVTGATENLIDFSNQLQRILPYSEITQLNVVGNNGQFSINFFFKPLDLFSLSRQEKINPLSTSDLNLLNQIKELDQ